MRTWLVLSSSLIPLWLSACNGGAAPLDSRSFLNGLNGPKVTGVNDALVQSAQAAEVQGNFAAAAQFYTQILAHKPDDAAAMLALADSYRRSGQLDKAISAYDALLSKDAKHIGAKEGKSLALIASGDFNTPATLLDEVMQAEPTRWKTLNALGILFTTRNLQPEAQQYFREALKHHPDSASIQNNLGLSQALERNFDGSVATLSKASELAASGSTERKRIELNTALVHASAGRLEDAKRIAEQYLTGAELDNNLGLYAHLAKDDRMAKAYLNKALSDSKVYYPKAWENLDAINQESADPTKKPADKSVKASSKPAKAVAKKETKPAPADAALPTEAAAPTLAPEAAELAPAAGQPMPDVSLADAPPAPPLPARFMRAKP
jgi:Flp pilus assembly protein TadD